ncbi:MAG: ABC transporter substrate-binding protein [Desulfovibrionaceae bacterium]|nr:ABC transporter substrate-binding protein [Desulfovibrionaceae bacterium]
MRKIRVLFVAACLSGLALLMTFAVAGATPPPVPERIKAVMVGDRLVDVALSLGVVPEGMSLRLSLWPDKAKVLPVVSQVLGCPNCVVKKRPKAVAEFMKERGITRLIVEKSAKFCLYMKSVNPSHVVPLVKDVPGLTVEYVDFTQGVGPAVAQAAKLFGREERGRKVAADYEAAMRKVEKSLPAQRLGRRVLVLNGMYVRASGKAFVRYEAPGGYSDQYILDPLGCTNVAGELITDTMKVAKGHVSAGRLAGLAKAAPDVIVATGDAFAVQKVLRDAIKADPSLSGVPAVKNGEIYALPFYADSGVLEYPAVFNQWRLALTP